MTNTKKIWQRPEMTVLVRSNPEEAVLNGCKTSLAAGPDAPAGLAQCRPDPGQSGRNCFDNASS